MEITNQCSQFKGTLRVLIFNVENESCRHLHEPNFTC